MEKKMVEFLYYISDSDDEPGMYEVCFTTVECWEEEHCQADVGIDEACELMSKAGLCEEAENFYLVEASQLALVKELLEEDARFDTRSDFNEFMESCGE